MHFAKGGDIIGAGEVPNRTIVVINGNRGDLPTSGAKPNSRYDLYVNGEKIQNRWFDEKGRVVRNRDYNHQNAYNNITYEVFFNKNNAIVFCSENMQQEYETKEDFIKNAHIDKKLLKDIWSEVSWSGFMYCG